MSKNGKWKRKKKININLNWDPYENSVLLKLLKIPPIVCVVVIGKYTQYPIIRNGHIRNSTEFLGKFKKPALGIKELKKRSMLRFSKLRNE